MRIPKHLSYSALALFEKNREAFYLRRMAPEPVQKDPQTKPMAVGNAFDALVKDALHNAIFGGPSRFAEWFESSTDVSLRDWARAAGLYTFHQYLASGAFTDLLHFLQRADSVHIETGTTVEMSGVPILGYADLTWSIDRKRYILDWKVRGYCGKRATSPTPGYVRVRDARRPYSRNHDKRHEKCNPVTMFGAECNEWTIDKFSKRYADQLTVYSWLSGVTPAEPVLGAIDEIVCKPDGEFPLIRVAQHRSMLPGDYRVEVARRFIDAWQTINDGIFDEQTREHLDEVAASVRDDGVFADMTRDITW